MSDPIAIIERDALAGTIRALRYLAFIEGERARLLAELYPDMARGSAYFVPVDSAVMAATRGSALDRASLVLRSLGIPDDAMNEGWTALLGTLPLVVRSDELPPNLPAVG
jgi:hypothetical protein